MLCAGSERHTNRLIGERSPYLLQHAHNPVEWYPWGAEAFEQAAKEGKPIFLSIGYSACHWCHVMERESFEDEDVAKLINDNFISIKVDREERPDIDGIYMRAAQALTGAGGWPLTVFMTPDREPFFAATYIPKLNSYGRVGLMELIPRIRDMWAQKREEIVASSREVAHLIGRMAELPPVRDVGESALRLAFEALTASFDSVAGGFGGAPKFPAPHSLGFLLRYHSRYGTPAALEMVERTLDGMRMGGIHDHVGGGFHRYSTDAGWLVPHFEKMLYDQALMAIAYTEGWQATGREEFRKVAKSTLDYAIRDLMLPDGGFACSEGAESAGEEGAFYRWTMRELHDELDHEEEKLISTVFDASSGILHMTAPVEEVAKKHAIDPGEFIGKVERALMKLYDARLGRERPLRDDKVLADWNGLMVAALAIASRAFGKAEYLDTARRSADFVLERMRGDDGGLLHSLRDAQEPIAAFADDYAFVVWGLIELYQASFDVRYLKDALALNERLMEEFADGSGVIFTTSASGEELPARIAESFDGATPSANSVHTRNLLMISRITGETSYERMAHGIMKAFAGHLSAAPAAHTFFLSAVDAALGPSLDVIVAGTRGSTDTEEILSAIRRPYLPDLMTLFREDGVESDPIDAISGFAAKCASVEGKATAYVCRGRACLPPATSGDEALAALLAKE